MYFSWAEVNSNFREPSPLGSIILYIYKHVQTYKYDREKYCNINEYYGCVYVPTTANVKKFINTLRRDEER